MGTSYGQVVSIFIKKALAGQNLEIFGNGEQTRSFSFVTDTVQGIILSSKYNSKNTEIFNLGSEDEVTINNLARRILVACGTSTRKVEIKYLPSASGDSPRRHPALLKARNLLGYESRIGLDKGLRITVDWFRSVTN